MNLGNGIEIASAWLRWQGEWTLRLTIYWHAVQQVTTDYAVAVHLVSNDPPTGPQDILAQADRQHPVGGWYPTSRWQEDEVVRDIYVIPAPPEATPVAVRLGMYHVDGEGRFQNTEWLSLEIPKPA